MNMQWIDWAILITFITFISVMAIYTKKYTLSVADFLSANRLAGKYLLGVGDDMASLGAITIIATFEMFYKAGFTAIWWQNMIFPLTVILAMTGFVQYRYRETKALTMGQFFEMRYSRKFRIFAGFVAFISGLINFAIFPAVGARFFQYFMGFPVKMVSLGFLQVDIVYASIVVVLVAMALSFTLFGGQIAVMVTDFLQGSFLNIMLVIITIFILVTFSWDQISTALLSVPDTASRINPLKTQDVDNFNVVYFLIMAFGYVYNFMAWQGGQGYFSAARSPHEAKMGRVVSKLRSTLQNYPLIVLTIAAFTVLHNMDFAEQAKNVHSILNSIAEPQLRSQLTVTVALTQILPIGLFGGFVAVLFAAFIANHDTYLHSWGVIFIQDVVLPIKQNVLKDDKPLSPKAHLRLLRYSIVGVAVFISLWSLVFNLKQDILMYFALTGSIFLSWAGSVIIGGLYWKYGTTKGAWGSAVIGIFLAFAGWLAIYQWDFVQPYLKHLPGLWERIIAKWPEATNKFPLNAQILYFYSMCITIITYVFISLITGFKKPFNLDKVLNRNKDDIHKKSFIRRVKENFWVMFGISEEFSLSDKLMFFLSYGYIFFFFAIFLIGTIYGLTYGISNSVWLEYWYLYLWFLLAWSVVITVWLSVGGYFDLIDLFKRLKNVKRDDRDDGTVQITNEN